MMKKLLKYQKLIPVVLIGLFLLSSFLYVAVGYKPTVEMSINDGPILQMSSRSEAEVQVYKQMPYKGVFRLTTGETFSMDMRLLGLSYFSQNELERLDQISQKTFWSKFDPFFEINQNQLISIYPQKIHVLGSLHETIKSYPHLLRQAPLTNALVVDALGALTITERRNGYEISEEAFMGAVEEIAKTGQFEVDGLESMPIEAIDQTELLAQYPHLVQHTNVSLSDRYVQNQNIETAIERTQNIYIASGETVNITELMGPFTAENGYLELVDEQGQVVYGAGVEQLIDNIQAIISTQLTVLSYKGENFSIGEPTEELTALTVQNTSASDVVLSLSLKENVVSIVLASK